MESAVYTPDDYESLLVALQNVLGIIVPESQRTHLIERIRPVLSSFKLDSLALLSEKLHSCDVDVCTKVLDVVSVRQPDWSFSSEARNTLHKYLFSQLPDKAKIWVVGCGQGQLAYSVLMDIIKFEHRSGNKKDFQLFATDVLQDDIDKANQAVYMNHQLSSLSDEDKKRFFIEDKKTGGIQIKDKFRQQINFSQCDLINDVQSMDTMDLIICPEVLVYFSNGAKAGVIQQFAHCLKPGGVLLTGNNQNIPAAEQLERVDHPEGVFYRQINS